MWCKNAGTTFFRFVTNHAFDRQTDGQTDRRTEFSSLDRVCILCSAVKTDMTSSLQMDRFRVSTKFDRLIQNDSDDDQ